MSISDEARYRAAATLRRWYGRTGEVQLRLTDADAAAHGWKRHARCGSWNPDAPDPELFFPIEADDAQTYAAQTYCGACPVREYCDRWADQVGETGVWGGIFRDRTGRYAMLCETPGCYRYRQYGQERCRACYAEIAAAKTAARPSPAPAHETAEPKEVVPV